VLLERAPRRELRAIRSRFVAFLTMTKREPAPSLPTIPICCATAPCNQRRPGDRRGRARQTCCGLERCWRPRENCGGLPAVSRQTRAWSWRPYSLASRGLSGLVAGDRIVSLAASACWEPGGRWSRPWSAISRCPPPARPDLVAERDGKTLNAQALTPQPTTTASAASAPSCKPNGKRGPSARHWPHWR